MPQDIYDNPGDGQSVVVKSDPANPGHPLGSERGEDKETPEFNNTSDPSMMPD